MGAATKATAKPAAPNLASRVAMLRAGEDGSGRGERMVVLPLAVIDAPPDAMLSSGMVRQRRTNRNLTRRTAPREFSGVMRNVRAQPQMRPVTLGNDSATGGNISG
jgi:hypothetical protein